MKPSTANCQKLTLIFTCVCLWLQIESARRLKSFSSHPGLLTSDNPANDRLLTVRCGRKTILKHVVMTWHINKDEWTSLVSDFFSQREQQRSDPIKRHDNSQQGCTLLRYGGLKPENIMLSVLFFECFLIFHISSVITWGKRRIKDLKTVKNWKIVQKVLKISFFC